MAMGQMHKCAARKSWRELDGKADFKPRHFIVE
jgi:hypothetical protein